MHTSKDKAEKAAKEADANIWVYLYAFKGKDSEGNDIGETNLGGHYVAYNYDDDKKQFHFYNGTPKDGYADIASQCFPNDILRFQSQYTNHRGQNEKDILYLNLCGHSVNGTAWAC
jgi:hypothetical protein